MWIPSSSWRRTLKSCCSCQSALLPENRVCLTLTTEGRCQVVRQRRGHPPTWAWGVGDSALGLAQAVLQPHRAWWPVPCAPCSVAAQRPTGGILRPREAQGAGGWAVLGPEVLLSLWVPIPADCGWPSHFAHALPPGDHAVRLCPGWAFSNGRLCLSASLPSVLTQPSPQPCP